MSEPTLEELREEWERMHSWHEANSPALTVPDAIIATLAEALRDEQAKHDELYDLWLSEAQRAEKAEAEVERLKCCGNCGHYRAYGYFCRLHNDLGLQPSDACHFDESRWTAREEDR